MPNKDAIQYIRKIADQITDPTLKSMAQNLIESAENARSPESKQKERKLKELRLDRIQYGKDNAKLDQYTKKYEEQNKIGSQTYKDVNDNNVLTYPYDIRKEAFNNKAAWGDSVRMWYEWNNLRKNGINVSLPELREYKESAESPYRNIANAYHYYSQKMQNSGFSPKTIELFKRIALSQMKDGKQPREAFMIAAKTIRTVSPEVSNNK